jgi:long-chain acyl-CoA synthetase
VRGYREIPPLTIENGQLTPTMKVRRRVALQQHAELIEQIYG